MPLTRDRGNIDLPIPHVLTLSAYASLIVVGGQDRRLPSGLAVVLGIGLLIGAPNAVLVCLFRIPTIIATLATGYVLATATLFANRWLTSAAVAPSLKFIVTARPGGLSLPGAAVPIEVPTIRRVNGGHGRTIQPLTRPGAAPGVDTTT